MAIARGTKFYYQDVKFGRGVKIAANSVFGNLEVGNYTILVTHDVEPFSIVGGVPAKFIKWRFDADTRDFLIELKWWDWPEEKIAENYERLCAFDKNRKQAFCF